MGKNDQKHHPVQQYSNFVELSDFYPIPQQKRIKKRRHHRDPVCLTILEKERFFGAIKSLRDQAIFGLMYYHGLRASEPGLLQYSDYRQGSLVRFDRLNLKRLKGSISHECAVVPAAAEMVRAWIRLRGTKQGPLFPSRNRRPIGRHMIFLLMQRYCKTAGIAREKCHPHVLKHSCAVHLLADQREGLIDVQRHLGHRNIGSTMVYLGALTEEFNEERVRRLTKWK